MHDLEKMYSELGFKIEKNDECVHVEFAEPRTVLSTAVVNGGLQVTNRIINLKVPRYSIPSETPAQAVSRYCGVAGWDDTAVSMITAASMDSLSVRHSEQQNVDITAFATVSLNNPLCAGDTSDYRIMTHQKIDPGTINIVVVTSAKLSPAALAEALMLTTEAKAAALAELAITSPVSKRTATGTATDGVAIASGLGPEEILHCGKNVLFGEILGSCVLEVVKEAVRWDLLKDPRQKT